MTDLSATDTQPAQDNQFSAHKEHSPDSATNLKEQEELNNIKYPEPWKWEKFFIGGYHEKSMLKFKNPKTMYKAINLFAGIAIMFYGYDQGVMALVNLNEDYWNMSKVTPKILSTTLISLAVQINSPETSSRNVAALGGIVAVYYCGTFIGALVAGSLADRCGRIKAVVFGCLWALLGAILQASAYNIAWMCCARVIAGVGVGAIDCVIPVWSAEVSNHSARGAFLAIEFFMVSCHPSNEILVPL